MIRITALDADIFGNNLTKRLRFKNALTNLFDAFDVF